MSTRPVSKSTQHQKPTVCGSLYGKALDFWSPMAVSPPRSPSSSPPVLATGSIYERLSDLSLAPAAITAGVSTPEAVRNLVHVHGVPLEEFASCCLVYFEDAGETVLASPTRKSLGAVLPRLVFADSVTWIPIVSPEGTQGHAFKLQLEGETQTTFEIIGNRVVVLQPEFSALAVEAGTASPSTRLIFESTYANDLAAVIANVREDEELGYLPNSDLLVGRQLDRIPLRGWGDASDGEARAVWKQTRTRLRSTNSLVCEGISIQNRRELSAAGVLPKEIPLVPLGVYFN